MSKDDLPVFPRANRFPVPDVFYDVVRINGVIIPFAALVANKSPLSAAVPIDHRDTTKILADGLLLFRIQDLCSGKYYLYTSIVQIEPLFGGHLASQIYLEIVNDSPYRLNQVVIISAAYRLDLGELDPGKKIDTYFNPPQESGVKIQVLSNNQVKEATITVYASKFGLDDSRIIVTKDSEIIIQKLKP